VCPACDGALRRLGEDADETLDIEPVVFKVAWHIRPKFSCRACEKIVRPHVGVSAGEHTVSESGQFVDVGVSFVLVFRRHAVVAENENGFAR